MSEFQEILPQRRRNNDKDLVDDVKSFTILLIDIREDIYKFRVIRFPL